MFPFLEKSGAFSDALESLTGMSQTTPLGLLRVHAERAGLRRSARDSFSVCHRKSPQP